MMDPVSVPVIAIDGPTASGKGTVTMRVARELGWHVLDSGAIYRLAAMSVLNQHADPADVDQVAILARGMNVRFEAGQIWLDEREVTSQIREERIGNLASELARQERLRDALLERQRAFRVQPGLVADGRDMGTVVFPDASLKIFLVANVEARARRRYEQLLLRGESADLKQILQDIKARDDRDMNRAVAPLRPADDAISVDSSTLSIEQTVRRVLDLWSRTRVKLEARHHPL